MQSITDKNIENNNISNFINNKFFKISLIFLGIIFSFAGAKILGFNDKFSPALSNAVVFTGLALFGFLVIKSIDNKIIPYFLLQFIPLIIFINQDLFAAFGLNLKLHAVIFGMSFLITFFYIIKNFGYLWNSPSFKFLLLFFILNLVYAFVYSSDFRSSNYIDMWIQNNMGLKYASIAAGQGAAGREFGADETRFLKYLSGIAPLVAFIVGYMSFYGLKTLQDTKRKFEDLIKLFSVGYLVYFAVLILCVLLGTASLYFMDNRLTIDNGFTGNDFDGLILLLFTGFNLYFSMAKPIEKNNWIRPVILINMIILSLFILLGIKKGTIISFLAGFLVIQACSFFFKKEGLLKINPMSNFKKNAGLFCTIALLPLIPAGIYFLADKINLGDVIFNISDRFSRTDTLQVREINWHFYSKYWLDNLTWFTGLFGFGTDASRETIFFLSAMHPDKGMQQPHIHNIYFEYFFNWGLLALFYFLPLLLVFYKSVKDIAKKNTDNIVKIISAVSMACVVFFLVFYTAESPAMLTHMTFFSLLGFLESAKFAFKKYTENSKNDINRISSSI